MYKGIKLRGQKSLAKAVLLGLALSSVFAGAAFAKDLVITQREDATGGNNKWEYINPDYEYNAYYVGNHTSEYNTYNNVTIAMNGYEQTESDNFKKPFNAIISEIDGHAFKADGEIYIKDSCSSEKSTNAVYTYFGYDKGVPDIDFRGAEKVVIIANALKDGYGSQAISAKNGGYIAVQSKETGYSKIIGDLDMRKEKTNKISLDLNNKDSYWYGNENNNGVSILDLTIRNGAEWIYTTGEKTSSFEQKAYASGREISAVTLKDGGIINLQNADVQAKFANINSDVALRSEEFGDLHMYDNGDHRYVSIGSLQGEGGIFKLDLQYTGSDEAIYDAAAVTDKSDYIYVTKEGSGSQDVQFVAADAKLDDMTTDSKLYFANDKSSGVTFTSSTVDALAPKVSAANLYDYEYKVKREEAAENGTDWYIGLDKGQENENKKIVDGVSKASFALATDMDRLNKRLGEARYLEGDDGLWVRYRHARTGWENSFKTSSNMIQLGYDKLKMDKDGKHYRGGALDYTDASTSLNGVSGHGDLDRYALSLYDTWIGDKGHYYDLVLRAGRVNSEFDALSRASETIKGKYHQFFVGISGEYGRKLASSNGWYVEPQAQLQIARVDSADYTTNYGVKVDQDAATSVISRLGFRLGRDVSDTSNIYLKADWLHEFCGDQEYRLTAADGSTTGKFDGKDSWWDVGIGADFKMGDSSYLYCDLERTLGGNYDRTWQANVGVRFEF